MQPCKRNRTRANSRSNQTLPSPSFGDQEEEVIRSVSSTNEVKGAAGLCRVLLLRRAGGDPHASSSLLGVLLVLEVELNPTTFVRFPVPKNLSSPRPDGDPLGALLLLPLPLLLGPPRLLQPLLPRLVDLDLLLPALLAAERHVTSAITKTATPPSANHSFLPPCHGDLKPPWIF